MTDVSDAVLWLDTPRCWGGPAVPGDSPLLYDCGGLANTKPTMMLHSAMSGVSSHQTSANRPLPASVTALDDSPELCYQHAIACC